MGQIGLQQYKMSQEQFDDTCNDLEAKGFYCYCRKSEIATYFKKNTNGVKHFIVMVVVDRYRTRRNVEVLSEGMLDAVNNLWAGNALEPVVDKGHLKLYIDYEIVEGVTTNKIDRVELPDGTVIKATDSVDLTPMNKYKGETVYIYRNGEFAYTRVFEKVEDMNGIQATRFSEGSGLDVREN
jgi:hypothetical protein